tara:strand:- start:216 stop:539 length:324 start_codon:yes stop_codon:yes gene_type:complete
MSRNSLAGSKSGKSSSARYYQNNKKARDAKKRYDSEYQNTEERVKYRENLNEKNRKNGDYGNKDGKDLSHTTDGDLVKENQSTNRGRNRGKKRKKKGGKRYPSLPEY